MKRNGRDSGNMASDEEVGVERGVRARNSRKQGWSRRVTSCCRGGAPDREGPPSLSCTLVITIVANPIVNEVHERHQVKRLHEIHEVSGFQLVGGDCLNLKETCDTGCTATGLTSYT